MRGEGGGVPGFARILQCVCVCVRACTCKKKITDGYVKYFIVRQVNTVQW